jgi:hypothetical protein
MPAPRSPKGGTRGTVYREIARQRLADAKSLLDHARFNGAIYLAGYAIECHLKFAVCERKAVLYLPADLEVHDWERLVAAAGLAIDIKAQRPMALIYYGLAERWGPALRYRTANYSASEASILYKEMHALYHFLKELAP